MNTETQKVKAWVVFADQGGLQWLKILRKGYRHCYVLLHDGKNWISVDPLSNHMDVNVHDLPEDFDFAGWLMARGYTVMEAEMQRDHMQMAPILPFSCVEAVKRILGIHAWSILTPWQLYKYLYRQSFGAYPQKRSTKENNNGWFGFSRNTNGLIRGS